MDSIRIDAPIERNILKETATSRTPGIFSIMHLLFTRTHAYIIGSAAFFIPLTSTLPKSGLPPRTTIFSIYNPNPTQRQIYSFPYYPGYRRANALAIAISRLPSEHTDPSWYQYHIYYSNLTTQKKGLFESFFILLIYLVFKHNKRQAKTHHFVYNVPSTALIL